MEWDLLVESEAISRGNLVVVEEECGSETVLRFIKKTRNAIFLKSQNGFIRKFDPDSLEEYDGSATIAGKYDNR